MNAIVPYVGRLAMRGAVARRSVNYGPYAMAAARVIGRAARNYLGKRMRRSFRSRKPMKKRARFSPRMVGMPVNSTTSKANLIANDGAIVRNSRTLYTLDVTSLNQGPAINQRLRQHANIRGFKICMEVKSTSNFPVYFNCAVLAPKSTTSNTVETTEFFRTHTDARSVNFNNALTGMEFHCLPINSDNYTILRHKRYVLTTQGAPASTFNRQFGTSWLNLDWYVPLKRQARYIQGESATPTDGRTFHVFWFSEFNGATGTGPAAVATAAIRTVVYYREPRN